MSDPNPWQTLTSADLAPVSLPSFVLQAGLTPTWNGWREGRFAKRAELFSALWNAFTEWRAASIEPASTPDNRLPVFWIEGRPGDGKSALLLQLMAACLQEQVAPSAGWLEHSPDGRSFRAAPPANSGWCFCAETPTRVEGQGRDSWVTALRESGAVSLVTSGSAEVRHGFECRFESQTRVVKWVLLPFSETEITRLAEWFQTRTGISREPSALWRDGMSLTEFLFALHHGKPLADLLSDARGALGNLGLGGRVRAAWLANALGLRVPATLIASAAAQDHAAKLMERGIMPVETGAAGLRLAPPTLAWPMVGTWLCAGHETHHLADALAFGLKAWLDAGDEENAIRFLRQLWGTEWLMDERPAGHGNPFIQLKRKDVLRELYRVHRRDFGGQPALATIPTWLELNEAFSLMLLPDPAVCATEIFSKPENESRRTPLLAAITWLAADKRKPPVGDDARKAVADYFLSPASGPGAGRALMRLVRDTKKPVEARGFAGAWVRLLPDHPEAMAVVGALMKRAGSAPEFVAWAAERFLQPGNPHPGAARLWTATLEGKLHDETLRRRATVWAWSHALEAETGNVWFTLLSGKLAGEDVVRGALRWLAVHSTHPEADVLRERLLAHYPESEGAAWLMQEWLPKHLADPRAHNLLLQLMQTQPNNRKASAPALAWLQQSLTHPSSLKVLRQLLQHPDLAVQAVADKWFDANRNSSAHAELLCALIQDLHGVAMWTTRGETYVAEAAHSAREQVVASLLKAHRCQLSHVRLAVKLLAELADAPRTFLETTLGRSLSLHPRQAEEVFEEFAGSLHLPDLTRALARGLTQLTDMREAFVRQVWPVMDVETRGRTLGYLVRANVRSPEIVSVLLEWLRNHHRERGYTPLLGALKNHPQVWDRLLATGRLDQRVITDFKNYRALPAERVEQSDAI